MRGPGINHSSNAAGDSFGTTSSGGTDGYGRVFLEIINSGFVTHALPMISGVVANQAVSDEAKIKHLGNIAIADPTAG
jgi:hypothetical protein